MEPTQIPKTHFTKQLIYMLPFVSLCHYGCQDISKIFCKSESNSDQMVLSHTPNNRNLVTSSRLFVCLFVSLIFLLLPRQDMSHHQQSQLQSPNQVCLHTCLDWNFKIQKIFSVTRQFESRAALLENTEAFFLSALYFSDFKDELYRSFK